MQYNAMKLIGLLGHPVGHSKSPLMHNIAFKQMGLPFTYAAFDVEPASLESAVKGLRALGFRGANVTIPHKVKVMEYIDKVDDEAKRIGAVNTIVNENGRLIGYNTDGIGYLQSLLEETGLSLASSKVLILGAGGATRAIAFALLGAGIEQLWITNRTIEKADQLAASLYASQKGTASIHALTYEQLPSVLSEASLLVNSTPVGMHPNVSDSPLTEADLSLLPNYAVVSDLIYNPKRTKLLSMAEKIGLQTHEGLGMFIHQGAYAFEYWTGAKAPTKQMRQVVQQALQNE